MIIITVCATKGGVGKTTTTANVGALLADLGMRVLLVDADPQPALTQHFVIKSRAPHGLTEMITRGIVTSDCISTLEIPPSTTTLPRLPQLNPNGCLDLIASDSPQGEIQDWLGYRIDRPVRMKQALRSPLLADNYDVILVDTQGAVGHLQDAAILAADLLLSPIAPDTISAREFLNRTVSLLDRLEEGSTMGISVPPMKAVIYRAERTKDSRVISTIVREAFVNLRGRVSILECVVPHAVAYKDAATAQVPVHWVDPVKASDTLHRLVWELLPNLEGIRTSDVSHQMPETDSDPADGAEHSDTAEAIEHQHVTGG
jgi:chromosome partitioning related protein ParA